MPVIQLFPGAGNMGNLHSCPSIYPPIPVVQDAWLRTKIRQNYILTCARMLDAGTNALDGNNNTRNQVCHK